ncbi:site-specific recombinase [Fluviicola chungangensis]|uniref:Recombinase n=1 Tax=Fluviicola chungangensis TaxID=2597671 RepID=A0A556N391_9FLAO|nr:recombinase [Fluviicola chungangensis]TSJ46508.1 recombinase [Fluviicola chungangensis]
MQLFRRSRKKELDELFDEFYNQADYTSNNLEFLVELVAYFRPEKIEKDKPVSIRPLLDYLNEHAVRRYAMAVYLRNVFQNRKFTSILTDSGIIRDAYFLREVRERIASKILPEQPEPDTLQFLLNQVFYRQKDFEWVQEIALTEINELIVLLDLGTIYDVEEQTKSSAVTEIISGISLLIQRISGRALEQDVLIMIPEYEDVQSPFESFEKKLDLIISKIARQPHFSVSAADPDFQDLVQLLRACHQIINTAFDNSAKFGISIRVNQSLLRIRQQLFRIEALLPLLATDSEEDERDNSIYLVIKLIKYNCRKNNIRRLMQDSTQTIAYEVTQHTAKTGEHYITESKKEYVQMLLTAMGGGLIVGFLCLFKVVLSQAHVSDFGHALLYSLNYSFGFILIYLWGFTLATKQPAMTAATIVKSIENGLSNSVKDADRYRSFAVLFSHLFRSQFIAFAGNVFVAFPVALLLIWSLQGLAGFHIVDEHKSEVLMKDLNPLASWAILHAAIAGVFLFLSGIISGSISNKIKHKKVYNRIKEHPVLKISLGKENAKRFAEWIEAKWAGVASNFWFGVFLGSTASIGIFLGLNLDIRHITFAAGNMALGLFGGQFETGWYSIVMAILGIGIIGFVNFIVSFALSLWLALRSRDIPISELKYLFQSVWLYFKYKPLAFFFPLKDS